MQILEKHLRVTFRGEFFSRGSSAFREKDNDFSIISKNSRQVRKILEILPSKRRKRVVFSNISTNNCPARNILEIYAKSTCSLAFFSYFSKYPLKTRKKLEIAAGCTPLFSNKKRALKKARH
jgi:hypothetical protein